MPATMSPRQMLDRLVSFPTVSSASNLDLIDFVDDWLQSHGLTPARVLDDTGEKASLFVRIGPDVPGGVVLSGHTDVVPVKGQDWKTDPFTVTEIDGRLHGRGTCDMKGFCATALALVPEMLAAELARPIVIALSYDEEVGCLGAPAMIDRMLETLAKPAAVIVGEPSEMQVVSGHKGSWGFTGLVQGHEVHSSLVTTGVSAVMAAGRMINYLSETLAENARTAGPSDFFPPFTTLHVGMVEGGTANNITARNCRFSGEVRVMPNEHVEDWKTRIRAEAARLEAELQRIHPDARVRMEDRMAIPQLRPEPGGVAETLARRLTGDNGTHVVSYQTEAGQFQERGLSTVVCGPGSIRQAHQPNEYLTVAQFDACQGFVRALIRNLET